MLLLRVPSVVLTLRVWSCDCPFPSPPEVASAILMQIPVGVYLVIEVTLLTIPTVREMLCWSVGDLGRVLTLSLFVPLSVVVPTLLTPVWKLSLALSKVRTRPMDALWNSLQGVFRLRMLTTYTLLCVALVYMFASRCLESRF